MSSPTEKEVSWLKSILMNIEGISDDDIFDADEAREKIAGPDYSGQR